MSTASSGEFRTVSGEYFWQWGGPEWCFVRSWARRTDDYVCVVLPALDIASRLVARDYAKSYVSRETKDGVVVTSSGLGQANGATTEREHLSGAHAGDIYVDEIDHMPYWWP